MRTVSARNIQKTHGHSNLTTHSRQRKTIMEEDGKSNKLVRDSNSNLDGQLLMAGPYFKLTTFNTVHFQILKSQISAALTVDGTLWGVGISWSNNEN